MFVIFAASENGDPRFLLVFLRACQPCRLHTPAQSQAGLSTWSQAGKQFSCYQLACAQSRLRRRHVSLPLHNLRERVLNFGCFEFSRKALSQTRRGTARVQRSRLQQGVHVGCRPPEPHPRSSPSSVRILRRPRLALHLRQPGLSQSVHD